MIGNSCTHLLARVVVAPFLGTRLRPSHLNSLFFAAIGVGLHHSWLGHWAIQFGIISAVAPMACNTFSEQLVQRSPPRTRACSGRWGFDPDDALYLMAPFAWLDRLSPVLAAAAVGTTVMTIITWLRLRRIVGVAASTVGAGSIW